MLWSKSKMLLDLEKINNLYVSSSKIKIRIQENSKPLAINNVEDLRKYFPGVDLTLSFWRKILTSIYLILSSARCCVLLWVVQGFLSWLSCPMLKPTSLFPVEINWLECLKSLLIKPVCTICSTLYVFIGFLQFVSSYLFKLYLV